MKGLKRRLTLDQPATYRIEVPGEFEESWLDVQGQMTITIGREDDGSPVTILTGIIDQATLQGLLRRLYSMGLPLISAICVENGREDRQ